MVVVVLTDCPPRLKGDLSMWLCEINTGVYVGNISTRVRELLWKRICDNVKHGQATMVYSAQGEQKMDFCVHNTSWKIVDFDGIKLMQRPLPKHIDVNRGNDIGALGEGFSKAAIFEKTKRIQIAKQKAAQFADSYAIVDIETTGLSHTSDEIIEVAALQVTEGKVLREYHSLVKTRKNIPEVVRNLTGICDADLLKEGRELRVVLQELSEFLDGQLLVSHNVSFDLNFLQVACKKVELPILRNKCVDTLALARKKLKGIKDYKLKTIADALAVDTEGMHRALRDCYITNGIYSKLKEI